MKLILDCIICVFGINTGWSDLKIKCSEIDVFYVDFSMKLRFCKRGGVELYNLMVDRQYIGD
jgi:hypothetical protein